MHKFCITYQLICTIWANYVHMRGIDLGLQVEAKPGEQTAVWSISPSYAKLLSSSGGVTVCLARVKKEKNMEFVRTLTIAEILVFGAFLYVYLLRKSK